MKKFKLFGLMLSVVCALAFSAEAFADKGKGRGHGASKHSYQKSEKSKKDNDTVTIGITIGDRSLIKAHIGERYKKNCPPGLAKKHNGCMPPGQAKKSYVVGEYLGHDIEYSALSGDLLKMLRPVPDGYMYVNVDKDVLLISQATKKVVDAVTLLSAVGN